MKAVVWTKEYCPYCVNAKQLLEQKGIEYEERVIGNGWSKQQLLEEVPQAKTVPQIFLDGVLIGGYDDLKKHF